MAQRKMRLAFDIYFGPKKMFSHKKKNTMPPKNKSNPWLTHLNAVKNAHPGLPYKEVLGLASKTYQKVTKANVAKKDQRSTCPGKSTVSRTGQPVGRSTPKQTTDIPAVSFSHVKILPRPTAQKERQQIDAYRNMYKDLLAYTARVQKIHHTFSTRAGVLKDIQNLHFISLYHDTCVLEFRTCDQAVEDLKEFWKLVPGNDKRNVNAVDSKEIHRVASQRGITVMESDLKGLMQNYPMSNFDQRYKQVRTCIDKAMQRAAPDPILNFCFHKDRFLYVPKLLQSVLYEQMVDLLGPKPRFDWGSMTSRKGCTCYLAMANMGSEIVMSVTVWPYERSLDMQEHALITGNLRNMIEGTHRPKNISLALHAYAGKIGKQAYIAADPLHTMMKIFRQAKAKGLIKVHAEGPDGPREGVKCQVFGQSIIIVNDKAFQSKSEI
jgi:hypothetical protein